TQLMGDDACGGLIVPMPSHARVRRGQMRPAVDSTPFWTRKADTVRGAFFPLPQKLGSARRSQIQADNGRPARRNRKRLLAGDTERAQCVVFAELADRVRLREEEVSPGTDRGE